MIGNALQVEEHLVNTPNPYLEAFFADHLEHARVRAMIASPDGTGGADEEAGDAAVLAARDAFAAFIAWCEKHNIGGNGTLTALVIELMPLPMGLCPVA